MFQAIFLSATLFANISGQIIFGTVDESHHTQHLTLKIVKFYSVNTCIAVASQSLSIMKIAEDNSIGFTLTL